MVTCIEWFILYGNILAKCHVADCNDPCLTSCLLIFFLAGKGGIQLGKQSSGKYMDWPYGKGCLHGQICSLHCLSRNHSAYMSSYTIACVSHNMLIPGYLNIHYPNLIFEGENQDQGYFGPFNK